MLVEVHRVIKKHGSCLLRIFPWNIFRVDLILKDWCRAMRYRSNDHSWLGSKCSAIEFTWRSSSNETSCRSYWFLSIDIDTGFVVGRNTPYKYIVVNIHYLSILKNDNSGNQIILSRTPYVFPSNRILFHEGRWICFRRKYRAGIVLGGTGSIYLAPNSHGQ